MSNKNINQNIDTTAEEIDDEENYPFNRPEYKVDEMKFKKSYDKKELLKIVSTFDETEIKFEENGDLNQNI